MRAATRRVFVEGPAGRIECALDAPEAPSVGAALIAHPHPLYGGTLDNKVVQTLARALLDLGYETWRPNFRGVGASEGVHDNGGGEVDDLASVLQAMPAGRKLLAGFSFGAAMQAKLASRVAPEGLILVGPAVTAHELPPVPQGTLVIHGENDTTIPLAAVLDWARPQDLPVVLVPGADHFFHRKLPVLRNIVRANCR
jgi:alpha/beta superfamily hydrolase